MFKESSIKHHESRIQYPASSIKYQASSIQHPSKNQANEPVLNYWPKLITFTKNNIKNERAFYKKYKTY